MAMSQGVSIGVSVGSRPPSLLQKACHGEGACISAPCRVPVRGISAAFCLSLQPLPGISCLCRARREGGRESELRADRVCNRQYYLTGLHVIGKTEAKNLLGEWIFIC
jgi:hypothetical protein